MICTTVPSEAVDGVRLVTNEGSDTIVLPSDAVTVIETGVENVETGVSMTVLTRPSDTCFQGFYELL